MKLYPDMAEEYEKRHNELWPEMKDMIHEYGGRNYTIFLDRHIPHGRANAMLLPHIIEFNSDINKHSKSQAKYLPAVERYKTVARILGLSSYNTIMTVRNLVNWVQFMLKEMDIPLSISQMGKISKEEYFAEIERMAEAALADGCTATNPRVPSKADVMKIYESLW